jgi:hypothetical protein
VTELLIWVEKDADDLDRPVEIHELTIKPVDFFTANPALDVPSTRNLTSKLADLKCCD